MSYKTVKAGYMEDLAENVKVTQNPVPKFETLMSNVKAEYDRILADIKKKRAKKDKEIEEREKLHNIALLRVRYTPDNYNSTTEDILDALLDKDKYLCLAYYLEKNRGYWSLGYSYAENGIDLFQDYTPSSDVDFAIINEICDILNDSGEYVDGRVFRDCTWNYNVLYGKVTDKQLLEDLQVLKTYDHNL